MTIVLLGSTDWREEHHASCRNTDLFEERSKRILAATSHLFTEGSNHRQYPEMNENLPNPTIAEAIDKYYAKHDTVRRGKELGML